MNPVSTSPQNIQENGNLHSQTKKLLNSFKIEDKELELTLNEWIHLRLVSSFDFSLFENENKKKLINALNIILKLNKNGLSGPDQEQLKSLFKDIPALDKTFLLLLCLSNGNAFEMTLHTLLEKEAPSTRPLNEEISQQFAMYSKTISTIQAILKPEIDSIILNGKQTIEDVNPYMDKSSKKNESQTNQNKKILNRTEDAKFLNFMNTETQKLTTKLSYFQRRSQNQFSTIHELLNQTYLSSTTIAILRHLSLYMLASHEALKTYLNEEIEANQAFPAHNGKETWSMDEHIKSAFNEFTDLLKMKKKDEQERNKLLELCGGVIRSFCEPINNSDYAKQSAYIHIKTQLKNSLKIYKDLYKKNSPNRLRKFTNEMNTFKSELKPLWQPKVDEFHRDKREKDLLSNLGTESRSFIELKEAINRTTDFCLVASSYLTTIQQNIKKYHELSKEALKHVEADLEALDEYDEDISEIQELQPITNETKEEVSLPTPLPEVIEKELMIEEFATSQVVENNILMEKHLIEFIQEATQAGIKSKVSQDRFLLESSDHFFMAGCGFEMFAKLLYKGELQHIGALYPAMLMDWHVQIEQALTSKYHQDNKGPIPASHSLKELAAVGNVKLSNELMKFLEDIDQGLLWSRYPFSSIEKYENKHKPLPTGLAWLKFSQQLLEGQKADAEELKNFVKFVVNAHSLSLQFERQYKHTHFPSILLKHFQPNGTIESTLLAQTTNNAVRYPTNTIKDALDLMNKVGSSVLTSALKDCQHHLQRLESGFNLSKELNDPHFTAWHNRNCTSIQWAIESLYVVKYFNEAKELLYLHDFSLFQQLLSKENGSNHDALLKFNYGIGAHYPRRKGTDKEFFGPFIQSINESKHAFEGKKNQTSFLLKTQSSIIDVALPAICNLLKNLKPIQSIKG